MAVPSQRKYDAKHAANLEKYAKQIRRYYLDVIKSVVDVSKNLPLNSNGEFYFRNHSSVNRKVKALLKELYSNVYSGTVAAATSEWDLAIEKNNEVADWVYGEDMDSIPAKYRNEYLSTNAQARRNFIFRKENGLNLSDRVWRNTRQLKNELELALEIGIGRGQSAVTMTKSVRQYLNEPERLFRRVRDKATGELRLSKAAKAYNPGRGVYRSSYKNALRLTANETNFSYEGSSDLKRQQQDFVVGVKIVTSPRHKASDDAGGISCDKLQGLYPKDFKFTHKWHVNCRCLSLTVLKSREELDEDLDKILGGGEPDTKSKNEVDKLPAGYNSESKKWIEKSKDWKNQPRTFANNKKAPTN